MAKKFKSAVSLLLAAALAICAALPVFASPVLRSPAPFLEKPVTIQSYKYPSLYLSAPTQMSNYRVYASSVKNARAQTWYITSYGTDPDGYPLYLIRLNSRQSVALNIAGDQGALVYDVTLGIPRDQGIHFADEGGKYGLVLNQHTPMLALTCLSSSSTSHGKDVYWRTSGSTGQQNDQFWTFKQA